MAIFSMNFNTVSRQPKNPDLRVSGRSAVAAVAYALTTSLKDERLGKTFNYAHGKQAKAKETRDLGLYFPGGKRILQKGRDNQGAYSEFWSKVELAEKRKDARTARTIVVALPVEMNQQEHENCLEKFQVYLASEYGMASQIGIHYDHEHNPHAHIVTTTRKVSEEGELGEKIRVLDSSRSAHFELKKIGEAWANFNNEILIPKYGTSITHKSFKEQGIDKPKGEHLGPYHWRKRQAELAEIEEKRARLEKELYGSIQQDDRIDRGTVQRTRSQTNTGIQRRDWKPDTQDAFGSIQQGIEGSSRREIREPGSKTPTEAPRPIQPVGAQRPANETSGAMRSGHSRDREKTNFFPDDNRNANRENARQAGSDNGRPTPTTKRSPSDASGTIRRAGKSDHKIRNNWQAESTLDKLVFLDNKLEDLNAFFELKQLQDKQQESLILRLDKALEAMQIKFDMEYLRGEHDGQPARADEAESESGNRIYFRLS